MIDFSSSYCIFPLPCGCVVEQSMVSAADEAIECPWCGATFVDDDVNVWGPLAAPVLLLEHEPKPLVRFGDLTLELVRKCSCGIPVARDFRRRSVEFHLLVPLCYVTRLFD